MSIPSPLPREARIAVTGATGLVGSAVVRALGTAGFHDVVVTRSDEIDLRDGEATRAWFHCTRPSVVVNAAARVGGIAANAARPVEFLHDNLRIQASVLEAAHAVDVTRLLFLGSSCIYPRLAPQPIPESALMTGPLESTNEAYAIAKIAGIVAVQAYRREYGRRWISAMPTNLYGPADNFDPETAHVLPALLHRFDRAVREGRDEVVVWGTGTPRREFLHVDDLAAACVHLLENYDDAEPINVGTGNDVTIAELARMVAETVEYTGRTVFDPSKPDGTPRKVLDVSRLSGLGWKPRILLQDGLAETYRWYRDEVERGADA